MGSTDSHDAFFDDLYVRTTEPFLTPAMTVAEVKAFVAMSGVERGARVLDLGCGWGRHGPALRERGFELHGLERAAGPAHRAFEKGLAVVRGDVRALPYRGGSFEAIACFYSSLFFFGEEENLQCLKEVARVLKPGGAFVLQAANPLHLTRLGDEEHSLPLPDGSRVWERTHFELATGCEVGERRLTLPTGEVHAGGFRIRHYAPGELEVLALRAGLRLADVRGSLSLEPWTRQSREVIALLRPA
jgi:SAM-dependent methyltransferase